MKITIELDTDEVGADKLAQLSALLFDDGAPAPKTSKPKAAAKAEEPPAEDTGPDISVAVAKATELVSAGETARVKDALKQIGVSRVSELTEDQVQTFLDLLDV